VGPQPAALPTRHHHDQERFAEFRDRYIGELEDADHRPAVQHLRDVAAHDKVTLLTATKDRAGLTPTEAAAVVGIPAGTARFRLHRTTEGAPTTSTPDGETASRHASSESASRTSGAATWAIDAATATG
jgi:hypothetical protein